ncbi:MAG TPA: alkaline phosphatase family protein [Vicinamibacterales bacterium]|nr:alkaline phosphatase family protein [Vicinamibacterales bacterium]
MHYLRMLTNAVFGGVLVATYVVVLVLQLNPHVGIASETAWRWLLAVLSLYVPFLTFGIFFLLVARELVGTEPLRPAWLSVRLLVWVSALGATLAAVLMWSNLEAFRAVLTAGAAERMREGAVATTASAAVLLVTAVLRYSFGSRGSAATALLLTVSLLASLVVPLGLRGPGEPPVPSARRPRPTQQAPPGSRVRLVLLDGASLGFIRQRVAIGQLPTFARLLDQGASMDLSTLRPTQAETVWAAAATGKYPPKNGIRSDSLFRVLPAESDPVNLLPEYCFAYALVQLQFVRRVEVTTESLTAQPLWAILSDYGLAAGIVGWPLTYPARAERGYLVSDHFDDAASSPLRLEDADAADPTNAIAVARDVFGAWLTRPWTDVLPPVSADEAAPTGILPARWDQAYHDTAVELEQQFAPRLTALRLESLAVFGHGYLQEAQPSLFGQVRSDAPQPSVLDRYYARVDALIGLEVARLGPGDLLLVVSGFGMEPVSMWRRLVDRILGRPELSGTHERGPDGFLLAYGPNAASGTFPRGSVVDLTPTVLYYLGLRVGRDMDGFARTDLFVPAFTRDRPVTYVATHER